MRKFEHDGGWWARRDDGTWLRWSTLAGDWEPTLGPPAGLDVGTIEAAAPPREPSVAFRAIPGEGAASRPGMSVGAAVLDFVASFFRMLLPLGAMFLLLPVLLFFDLLFMFLSPTRLTPPMSDLSALTVFCIVTSAFVASAIATFRWLGANRPDEPMLRWVVAGTLALAALPVAWLATGDGWSGSLGSKLRVLGTLGGSAIALEALVRVTGASLLRLGPRLWGARARRRRAFGVPGLP
jgi:hypothetical protein